MSLNGLPNEILLSIISHSAQSETDLAALCLSSRHLRQLTTPILYRKLCYCRDDYYENNQQVPLRLRSLLRNRALGEFVQELDISPKSCSLLSLLFTYDDKILIQKVVKEIVEIGYIKLYYSFSEITTVNRLEIQRKWYEEASVGRWYALITIIVFLCPGLRQIHYTRFDGIIEKHGEENYMEWFFRVVRHSQQAMRDRAARTEPGVLSGAQHPTNVVPLLPHLRHVNYDFSPQLGPLSRDMGTLEPCLLIQTPSVESLHVHGLVQFTQVGFDVLLGLKSLTLEQCVCKASVFGNILRACVRLEYFSYVHGHEGVSNERFEPLLMMDGLSCLTGSLRELRLARGRPRAFKFQSATNSRLGSLSDFNVLINLHLPVEFLVGVEAHPSDVGDTANPWIPELWELVPRSLENLLISGHKKEVILAFAQKEVLELVRRKASVAPRLKSIALVNTSFDEVDGRTLVTLRGASAANQILLSIRKSTQCQ